ncbi:MAG: hypothetical protein RL497_422 [Pseudomonadota bacterium]
MHDIRWKQRFDNWQAAYLRLQEAVAANAQTQNNALIQMALIKGFEMTFELSWKTMKDYLAFNGIEVSLPREVIKHAFAHKIIDDGQVWIDMLDDRNLMAHTYDETRAQKAVEHICSRYLLALQNLQHYLHARLV